MSQNGPAVIQKLIEFGDAKLKLGVSSRDYVDVCEGKIFSLDLSDFEEEFCCSFVGSYNRFSLFVH